MMPSMRKSSRFRAVERAMRAARANRSHEERIVLSMVDVYGNRTTLGGARGRGAGG